METEKNMSSITFIFDDKYKLNMHNWVSSGRNLLLTENNYKTSLNYTDLNDLNIPLMYITSSDVVVYSDGDKFYIVKNKYGSNDIVIDFDDELYSLIDTVINYTFHTVQKVKDI